MQDQNNLTALFKSIPQLAAMAAASTKQDQVLQTSKRRECLARLPGLRAAEDAAEKKLQTAMKALESARASAQAKESAVLLADEELRSARNARSSAERDLVHLHGDGHVVRGAYTARQMLAKCDADIANLEAQEYDRTLGYARPRHDIRAKLTERREERKAIAKAVDELSSLIASDAEPHQLGPVVDALLHKAGYRPNPQPVLIA